VAHEDRGRERRRLALVVVPLVVLSLAGIAAAALTPLLVRDAPLLLLLLESRNRYLLLVAAKVDPVPFVVVGVLRRLASDPFYYLLGRWYGDRALRWVSRRAGDEGLLTDVERAFARVAAPAVVLFPGALVCALAGSTGMPPRRFAVLNVLGSVAAVVGLRLLADAAAGPLGAVVGFSDRNAGRLTAVFVLLTLGWLVLERRRGRHPLGGVGEAADQLGHPRDGDG
jgi:membrane protein DedA with SNARE-associated domain